jgi:hypothetical protein
MYGSGSVLVERVEFALTENGVELEGRARVEMSGLGVRGERVRECVRSLERVVLDTGSRA